jgi:lysophospholipase L1-like esterase
MGLPARINLAVGVLGLTAALLVVEVVAVVAVGALGARDAVDAFRARQTQTTIPNKVAHPFLIITNNPALPSINALGFPDRDHPRRKPAGTIRIACLGGSTTEDGYPQRLEAVLVRELPDVPVEVLNFGVGYWTTAQTLINYALTVKYFAPDYLIVHDGANELQVRSYAEFRTDYAHALHPMEVRLGWDAPLVRHLESYAVLKYLYLTARGLPPALHVGAAIQTPRPPRHLPLAPHELEPFRENLTELVYMARRRGTEVVFVTQPYSRSQPGWHREWASHMDTVNGIVRTLAAETGAQVVDLDPEMTGREEYFIDALHLTSDATSLKAERIAAALIPILRASRSGDPR